MHRCQLLEMQLSRKQTELDNSKQRNEQLQRKYDESTAEFEQRLDLARDKERQLITVRISYFVFVPFLLCPV